MGYTFHITDRDIAVLTAVGRYRFLQTSQVRRAVFAPGISLQPVRRRLRHLKKNNYLGVHMPPTPSGKGSAENAFFLTERGRRFLAEHDVSVPQYQNAKAVKTFLLKHSLAVSETYIALDEAVRVSPTIRLRRSVADFEMKHRTQGLNGHHRYRLFQALNDPTSGQEYVVYPDLLAILSGTGQYSEQKKGLCFEVDMGTEGLNILRKKVIGYDIARRTNSLAKFGIHGNFRVLFIAQKRSRVLNILEAIEGLRGADIVWAACQDDVQADTLLGAAIWVDSLGNHQSILRQS